jgi:hypothetical protein
MRQGTIIPILWLVNPKLCKVIQFLNFMQLASVGFEWLLSNCEIHALTHLKMLPKITKQNRQRRFLWGWVWGKSLMKEEKIILILHFTVQT